MSRKLYFFSFFIFTLMGCSNAEQVDSSVAGEVTFENTQESVNSQSEIVPLTESKLEILPKETIELLLNSSEELDATSLNSAPDMSDAEKKQVEDFNSLPEEVREFLYFNIKSLNSQVVEFPEDWISILPISDQNGNHLCTVAVIGENAILTAAHCVDARNSQNPKLTNDVFISLPLPPVEKDTDQKFSAPYKLKCRMHTEYSDSDIGNVLVREGPDLALCSLEQDWDNNTIYFPYFERIDLSNRTPPLKATLGGYGCFSKVEKEAQFGELVPLNQLASKTYRIGNVSISGLVSEVSMMESSWPKQTIKKYVSETQSVHFPSLCKGDSGGPVFEGDLSDDQSLPRIILGVNSQVSYKPPEPASFFTPISQQTKFFTDWLTDNPNSKICGISDSECRYFGDETLSIARANRASAVIKMTASEALSSQRVAIETIKTEAEYCFPKPFSKKSIEATDQETTVVNGRVIYGSDNRRDFFCLTDSEKSKVRSSVALVKSSKIKKQTDGTFILSTSSFQETFNVCEFERFSEQRVAASCSGVLIAPKEVLTAAHCVQNLSELQSTSFVFGFQVYGAEGTSVQSFTQKQIYTGSRILGKQKGSDGTDWAHVELDRVVDESIASPAIYDKNVDLFDSQLVHVVGYPAGLAMKFADGAEIVNVSSGAPIFVSDIDTYAGSSGSPVFDHETNSLIGLVTGGEIDFINCKDSQCYQAGNCSCENNCKVSKVCTTAGCSGESVMKISEIEGFSR